MLSNVSVGDLTLSQYFSALLSFANVAHAMLYRGLQLNNTVLVGHSLGAQAAGVAGSALTSGELSDVAALTGTAAALMCTVANLMPSS